MKKVRNVTNTYMGIAGVIAAASLCLAGCGAAGQDAGAGTGSGDLNKEDMARICLYRTEKDEQYEADMKIVEGRIDALTDGRYIKEETTLETNEGPRPAVEFYVPGELYGDNSLRDTCRILISRPMDLMLGNDTSKTSSVDYTETIELPREAISSVEVLYGCPESLHPFDYGSDLEEFNYIKVTLTEDYCRQNPQIRDWQNPGILQDFEGYSGYAYYNVELDKENSCFYWWEDEDQVNRAKGLSYSYTHEPLSDAFYILTYPIVEWESGEDMKGEGQIEYSGFTTPTMINAYAPAEEYVSAKNWEQTLEAIRERLDATGLPYALGHLPDNDRSIVIRIETGPFVQQFMDLVVDTAKISLSTRFESIPEDLDAVTLQVSENEGKPVIALDMSALKKDTLNKLSGICESLGGSRILLKVNSIPMAYGYCDKTVQNGLFTLDNNAVNGLTGFDGEMEWLPGFLAALIDGTPIPMRSYYSSAPAVTLEMTEQICLDREGKFFIPASEYYDNEPVLDGIRQKLKDLSPVRIGLTSSYLLFAEFDLPEGDDRNGQIADIMSKALAAFGEDIFTYGASFDFIGPDGNPVLRIMTRSPMTGDMTGFEYYMKYAYPVTETDATEIESLLDSDPALAGLIAAEE